MISNTYGGSVHVVTLCCGCGVLLVDSGMFVFACPRYLVTYSYNVAISSFVFPVYDKTVLVIPKPERNTNIVFQTHKVFQPFTYSLWAVVIAVVVVASLLSVWFSDRDMLAAGNRSGLQLKQSKRPRKRRKRKLLRR